MGTADAQYNSSTSKAMYTSGTAKAQTVGAVPGCADCAPNSTPPSVDVTFDSVAGCGCVWFGGDLVECWLSTDYSSTLTAINDSWTVPQTASPCIYQATFTDAVPIAWYSYDAAECDTFEEAVDCDLRITVNVTTAAILAEIYFERPSIPCSVGWVPCFSGSLSPDVGYCLTESGVSNTEVCQYFTGGTADIIEN